MTHGRLRYPSLLVCLILLCLGGAWVSNELLTLHDSTASADGADRGLLAHLCRSSATAESGCDGTAKSAWSEISLGAAGEHRELPVALVGVAYFLFLAVWFAFTGGAGVARKSPRSFWRPGLPLTITFGGGYASLFLIGLMLFGRVPWCAGCVAVHAINALIIGMTWVLARSPRSSTESIPADGRSGVMAVATALMLISVLYAGRRENLILRDERDQLLPYQSQVVAMQRDESFLIRTYLDQPRQDIPPRAGDPVATGKHVLTVFMDYECLPCAENEQAIRSEIEPDFGTSLSVSLRQYPLCRDCNDRPRVTIHPNACKAAYAAEAARLSGGSTAFERMTDLLFANRTRLGEENIYRGLATQAGLNPATFLKNLNDPSVRQVVADDIATAGKLGVRNTPAMFLDGRHVPDICLCPTFWKAATKLPIDTFVK